MSLSMLCLARAWSAAGLRFESLPARATTSNHHVNSDSRRRWTAGSFKAVASTGVACRKPDYGQNDSGPHGMATAIAR